jgi:hypothetical protein
MYRSMFPQAVRRLESVVVRAVRAAVAVRAAQAAVAAQVAAAAQVALLVRQHF